MIATPNRKHSTSTRKVPPIRRAILRPSLFRGGGGRADSGASGSVELAFSSVMRRGSGEGTWSKRDPQGQVRADVAILEAVGDVDIDRSHRRAPARADARARLEDALRPGIG